MFPSAEKNTALLWSGPGQSNHEGIAAKSKLKDILPNNWPLILKNVNDLELKESPQICLRLKKTKGTTKCCV